ncbi:MFS transporter [Frankia sp. Cr1]|uniref:MFS transporter n=1 Tax=Frankia sp. Cr1 TaxID=3073931 RepID=UPI002AD5A554|nr:MFS transporter [Frankia sp. Cr1]
MAQKSRAKNSTEADTPAGVFATIRATPPSVRYLLGGVLINQLGAFVQTFLVLYLAVRGFSIEQAGIALTAYSVGAVCGTLLGGELTHRIGPRATIAGSMLTSSMIVGLVPWLSSPARFGLLVAAVALAGLVTQSYRPAAAVLLSELMPEEHRVMAFSMMRTALNIGAALGPLIAAGLILLNWDLLFWLDAGTAFAYAVLARTFLPDMPAAAAQEKPTEDKRSAYGVLLRDRNYLLFLASVLLGSMIYVQYMVALPLKITADGHSAALYSVVLATSSLTVVLCELKITFYVKNWRPNLVGAFGTALMGVGLAAYGLATRSVVLIILSTVVFVFGVMINGPTMFAHPATFPATVKARYIGAHYATFGLGLALGPTLGVLAWQSLANGVWPVCGGIGVIAALCALVGMRENERHAHPRPTQPETLRRSDETVDYATIDEVPSAARG